MQHLFLMPPTMTTTPPITSLNALSAFLAHAQIDDLDTTPSPVDCIVLCGSSILHTAESVFRALTQQPTLAKVLVICGGIGHSTTLLRDALARNSAYAERVPVQDDLSEAQILHAVLLQAFDLARIASAGCQVLLETRSTNCGANATCTHELLRGFQLSPRTVVIVQDPTMSLRTLKSFEKAFADDAEPPTFMACPTFVPVVEAVDDGGFGIRLRVPVGCSSELWPVERLLKLLVGEIPRLRDDEKGYGPRGKGFIGHVDIPLVIEAAWEEVVRWYPNADRIL